MTILRRNAKRDSNEKDLVELLRTLGASVFRLSVPVDLLIGYSGKTVIAEVKSNDTAYGKRLNTNQENFALSWRGSAIAILRTDADVIALLKEMEG